MPDLPTFTITQAQADRILAAFGSVQNYRDWLSSSVRDYVFQHERRQILQEYDVELQAKLAEIKASLGM
jgi:hypothetical protein